MINYFGRKNRGQKILLVVTGGISAYKVPGLVRDLQKAGAELEIVMTKNATKFVSPLVLSALIGKEVGVKLFSKDGQINHIEKAQDVDLVLVVPATANFLAKYAGGYADDLVHNCLLVAQAPVVVAPAMNCNMWNNLLVQANVRKLSEVGVNILMPDAGDLACGMVGAGRLPANDQIIKLAYTCLRNFHDGSKTVAKPLAGKKVLITAGATKEYADRVRFLSNDATGTMGMLFALEFKRLGAEVVVVSGFGAAVVSKDIEQIEVIAAADMLLECQRHIDWADYVVATAAVADYCFGVPQLGKLRKGMALNLQKTCDVLETLALNKRKEQVFVGFALETAQFDQQYLAQKAAKKKMDFLIVNDPESMGDGLVNGRFFDLRKGKFLELLQLQKVGKLDFVREVIARFC